MPRNDLSPEFLLIASACEWPRTTERDGKLRRLAADSVNWALVLDLAVRHRIEGLVSRALTDAEVSVPEPIQGELRKRAALIGTQNLLQTAESARLQKMLAEHGIGCIFLKGVTLGALAYDVQGVKQAWDIDLLVAAEAAEAAVALLHDGGYERSLPGPEISDDQFRRWMTINKESLWIHKNSGMVVELHTWLVDSAELLPTISARSSVQMVRIGPSIALPTLETDELFAYLCVHGATHAWARLKWLADVAALLRKLGPEEAERLYRRSIELGAGRSSAQALLLCSELLALPVPDRILKELQRDPATKWLVKLAVRAMSSRGATELDDTVFGTVVINLSHFLLQKGLRHKYGELVRKTRNPEDQLSMPLPSFLGFIYPILAVPRWIWRRYRLSRS